MSTTSRQHLYGSTIRASAERAKKARKEADRPAYEAWNFRMLGYKGPAQPSPTIGDALNAGYSHALPVSTSKSDRLPWPPPAKPEPAIKPAEPIDYAQADAEAEKKVRRAHAEAPDLCQRHGMHKVWTKDGKSWRCRR